MPSVACAFIEFSDPSDSSGIKIRKTCDNLTPLLNKVTQDHSYDEALLALSKSSEYIDAKNIVLNDFYWEIGKYTAKVSIEYGKQKTKTFSYCFTVSEQSYIDLHNNINESLIAKLKEAYSMPLAFKSSIVEVLDS